MLVILAPALALSEEESCRQAFSSSLPALTVDAVKDQMASLSPLEDQLVQHLGLFEAETPSEVHGLEDHYRVV